MTPAAYCHLHKNYLYPDDLERYGCRDECKQRRYSRKVCKYLRRLRWERGRAT
jgi:hypothetical protein